MSEFLVIALRLGFLALLWLFIALIGHTIRTDLFGRKVATADLPAEPELSRKQARKKTRRAAQDPRALTIVEGRQQGLEVPLDERIVIGRSPDSTLLLDDDYVSTRHATLAPDGQGGYYVEDHGSTNGTYINETRITAPTAIGLPDTLRIGRTTMRVVP